jgi:hypothetical protein
MTSTEVCFAEFDAARKRGPIRWALFEHRAVIDVQLTARPDTLQVKHHGSADLEGWNATLVAAGLPAAHLVGASTPAAALHGASA